MIVDMHIHYDELNKRNFWNTASIDVEKCKKEIRNINSKMIYLELNGLSESNSKKIDLIIRRNI